MLNLCANLKNSLYRPVSMWFCWNRSVTFRPKASSSSHSYQRFRVISAHYKIGPCQFRPIAISAYKFNVNPDFKAAKEIVNYWKYKKLIKRVFIGPIKQKYIRLNCDYFLVHQFKHVFWVLKRTVSSRRFFRVPTTFVLVEKKSNTKNNFQLRTVISWVILRKKILKIDKLEELLKARTCQSLEHFIIGPRREKTCLRGFWLGLT